MIQQPFTITASNGLHARPAAELVKAASIYQSEVTLRYNDKNINLKSILGVMSLGVPAGSTVTIIIDGSDEDLAIEKITDTFTQFDLGKPE